MMVITRQRAKQAGDKEPIIKNGVAPPNYNPTINLSGIPMVPNTVMGTIMLVAPPIFVWLCWYACNAHRGSLGAAVADVYASIAYGAPWGADLVAMIPRPTLHAWKLFLGWFSLQALLYVALPARIGTGQATPAGHVLRYKCNGLAAWLLTHALVVVMVKYGVIKATVIADNWGALFVVLNLTAFLVTILVYVKAHAWPTHADDRCFSGSLPYDLFMGVELNPRLGRHFDFKLFFNGRPGILAWTLINLSFAAKQYEDHGFVSNSMLLLNILHAIYVLDFFYNEDWYLRTVDIAHDHFGFYLAWGSLVWLPYLYTMQSFYLARNPVVLPAWGVVAIALLGLGGYALFRSANHQKDAFRRAFHDNTSYQVWGREAEYIAATYRTNTGEVRRSPLLASGWWGVARHFNYVGDLMNSMSYCLTCGFAHILPYYYITYMTILLVHRVYRDDIRCRQKYGAYWEQYCERVPYKIIPYIF